MSRHPARFTQADLVRALRAVIQTGARVTVEIAEDGTIRLVPVVVGNDDIRKPTPIECEEEIVV